MAHHTLLLKEQEKFYWPWQCHHWGQRAGDPGEKDEVQDAPRAGFQPPGCGVMQICVFALG